MNLNLNPKALQSSPRGQHLDGMRGMELELYDSEYGNVVFALPLTSCMHLWPLVSLFERLILL